jgi:ABC-2 type transport system ATP-binding protein
MAQQPTTVIQTSDLSKFYGNVTALNGLDLTVPANTIFGFLGPNGAGKSTTMKLLLGLARPSRGAGTVFGLDIVDDSLAIRRRIGYLPQQPRFYESMTARETLRFTASLFYQGPATAIDARVREMLALVRLEDKADRPVKGFSGGERQRLGLAQAQINAPDLLILDEPAAALDPIGRHDVLAIMEQLRERTTIFYSTHILDDVQQVSDTVAILNQGELIMQGPVSTLLAGDGLVYEMTTRGGGAGIEGRLSGQPWVGQVDMARRDGLVTWHIGVTDEAAAEAQLLRMVLADDDVIVTGFQQKRYELEEVFMKLVEENNHVRS